MKEWLDKSFSYIDPSPFVIWAICAVVSFYTPLAGVYIEANATLINISLGAVITSICLSILVFLVVFIDSKDNCFFEYVHWIGKLFSDAALGSAGFVVILQAFLLKNYELATVITLISLVYVIAFNHVFLTIFNKNEGTKKLAKQIDLADKTDINGNEGLSYRKLELRVMAGVLLTLMTIGSALGWLLA
ncbi:TPA: hypothetical protein I7285_12780 [Vibrio parahaemolyticus]|nr:hypothetical protein [Vibrio parahaemolyticus]